MTYNDYAANLHINFKEGNQHLNGKKLIEYIRFRNNAKGDIGRIVRQQEIIQKIFNELFQIKNLLITPRLISIFTKNVSTDLSFSNINHSVKMLLSENNQTKLKFFTVPGSVRLIKGVSYWRPNIVYLDKIITETFTHGTPIEQDDDPAKENNPSRNQTCIGTIKLR